MSVITSPQQFNQDDLYVDLEQTVGHALYLKCEGFNFAGSVKLKAANAMVTAAERLYDSLGYETTAYALYKTLL